MIIGSKWRLVGRTDDKEHWGEQCKLGVIYSLVARQRSYAIEAALIRDGGEWASCDLADSDCHMLREIPEDGYRLDEKTWRSLTVPGIWKQEGPDG